MNKKNAFIVAAQFSRKMVKGMVNRSINVQPKLFKEKLIPT